MLNKNDVVTVEITDIGVGGEGIGAWMDIPCLLKMRSSGM